MVGDSSAELGRLPADVQLVRWPSASPGGASINEVAATLKERELLVLPEASEPYLVDSSRGFQWFRADAPWGETTEAELWDEMTRLPVGLVGMGPGTRVETSASSFGRGPQLKVNGGCSNKVIGVSRAGGYFGDLVAGGRDYGGVAFHYFAYSPSARLHADLQLPEQLRPDPAGQLRPGQRRRPHRRRLRHRFVRTERDLVADRLGIRRPGQLGRSAIRSAVPGHLRRPPAGATRGRHSHQ